MNTKQVILTLGAVCLLLAGCSDTPIDNTEPGKDGPEEIPAGQAALQLVFEGGGENVTYPGTRAQIATPQENQIDNLTVYVFGAPVDTESAYKYQETWTMGSIDDTPAKTFTLQGTGASRKATIFPDDATNKFFRMYCVANAPTLHKVVLPATPGAPNPANTAVLPADWVVGTTTPAQLEAYATGTFAVDSAFMTTPLTMTGKGVTASTRTRAIQPVYINLERLVARFDIVNNVDSTGFTLTHISMVKGRPWSCMFTPIGATNFGTKITYPEREFTGLENANHGTTISAMYAYPCLKTDSTYLLLKGTFYNAETRQQVPVQYPVYFHKTTGGVLDTVNIQANNRYTLLIKSVTESNIIAGFVIEDWTLGGGITFPTLNGAPVPQVNGANVSLAAHAITVSGATAGSFELVSSCSGKTTAELKTDGGWISMAADPVVKTVGGETVTVFTINYTVPQAAKATIILRNAAAGTGDESKEVELTIQKS